MRNMNADERVISLAQEQLSGAAGGELALVGGDNPYFRAIRKAGTKSGITVVDGFHATMPVLVDVHSGKEHVLTEHNDIDHLVTEGLSCVAEATLILLRSYGLVGKHVVIVGRGHAVKGLAKALVAENATVTVCHSRTKNLTSIMQDADMLVVAAPIAERLYPIYTMVIVDISGAYAESEGRLQSVCEYTRHIGKLTVAVLLRRVSERMVGDDK